MLRAYHESFCFLPRFSRGGRRGSKAWWDDEKNLWSLDHDGSCSHDSRSILFFVDLVKFIIRSYSRRDFHFRWSRYGRLRGFIDEMVSTLGWTCISSLWKPSKTNAEYRKDFILFNSNVAYLFLRTIAYNFRSGVVSRSECKHGTGENRDTRGLLSVFIYCINFATVYFGNNSCGTLDRDTEGIRSVWKYSDFVRSKGEEKKKVNVIPRFLFPRVE